MQLRTALPQLSAEGIRTRLLDLGVNAHPDYVAHLAAYNGADATDYKVRFGSEGTAGLTFVGFDYDFADLEQWASELSDKAFPGALPLALDAMGNAFVVGASGRVRFWDHDTNRSVAAFDTITDFIDALVRIPGTESTDPDFENMALDELIALVQSVDEYLFQAAFAGRRDIVDYMMQHHPQHAARAMFFAASGGHLALVRDLRALGIDVDPRSPYGQTPLMTAAAGGHRHVIEYLLSQGANPTLRNHGGRSASQRAMGKSAALLREAEAAWIEAH